MASPKKFVTANEIDADPTILRDPNAREKTRNRSGQGGGSSKAYIKEAVSMRPVAMQESPAYRVLTLSAHRILDRLEIEFAKHGFKPEENGQLPCTYEDFVEYGISRNEIAPAIRELSALGIVRVTRRGSAGNEAHRQTTLFLLTYRADGSDKVFENGWRRIKTLEEAEKIAKAARSAKADRRASEFGRRRALARWRKQQLPTKAPAVPTKNKSRVMESILTPVMESILKPEIPSHGIHTERADSPVMESIPLTNIFPGGPLRQREVGACRLRHPHRCRRSSGQSSARLRFASRAPSAPSRQGSPTPSSSSLSTALT
jgi:hypothetical protein